MFIVSTLVFHWCARIYECGNCFIKRTFQSHCVSARVFCKNIVMRLKVFLYRAELFFVQWNLCYIDQEFFTDSDIETMLNLLRSYIHTKPTVFIKTRKIFCVCDVQFYLFTCTVFEVYALYNMNLNFSFLCFAVRRYIDFPDKTTAPAQRAVTYISTSVVRRLLTVHPSSSLKVLFIYWINLNDRPDPTFSQPCYL